MERFAAGEHRAANEPFGSNLFSAAMVDPSLEQTPLGSSTLLGATSLVPFSSILAVPPASNESAVPMPSHSAPVTTALAAASSSSLPLLPSTAAASPVAASTSVHGAVATSVPLQPPFDAAHPFFPSYKRYVDLLTVLREVCESRPLQQHKLRFSCDPALVLFLWHVCTTTTDPRGMRTTIEEWLSPLITSVASLPHQRLRLLSYQLTLHRASDWYFSPHLTAELVTPFEAMQTLWCGEFQHTGMTLLSEVRSSVQTLHVACAAAHVISMRGSRCAQMHVLCGLLCVGSRASSVCGTSSHDAVIRRPLRQPTVLQLHAQPSGHPSRAL